MPRAGEDRWHLDMFPACKRVSSLWFSCSPTLPKLLSGQPGRLRRSGRCSGSHRRRAHRARGPQPPFAVCLRLSVSAWALPMSPAPLWTAGPPKSGQATAVRD